ncbi:MAG TPA: hypothetical protein VLI39_20510 [Sedimentisphaerales bacterium]|nr:hypothetical protein [Sedimentisphaerales bacterium]
MHWSQIRTILWLRWRLTRNQWARGGRLSVGISIAIMVILLVIGIGGGIGGLCLGVFKLTLQLHKALRQVLRMCSFHRERGVDS